MVKKLKRQRKKVRKCEFNSNLECPIKKKCPLRDERFTGDLDLYLYKGRTPKALVITPTDGGMTNDPLNTQVHRAAKAMVFADDDMMMEYVRFDRSGLIQMTYRSCRQWRMMRLKWTRMMGKA